MEEYNNEGKTFGLEEVKLFAQLLAPKYGIAVHNSLVAAQLPTGRFGPLPTCLLLAHCPATLLVCVSHLCAGLKSLVTFVTGLTHSLTIKCISEQFALQYFWVSYLTPSLPTARFLKHLLQKTIKIVPWINLLNLNDHFNPITKPSGFFETHYWCDLCNKCYADKQKHNCIPICVACKTLDTENCNFKRGKTVHCSDCNLDFYGEAYFANHKSVNGKKKTLVCQSHHCIVAKSAVQNTFQKTAQMWIQ